MGRRVASGWRSPRSPSLLRPPSPTASRVRGSRGLPGVLCPSRRSPDLSRSLLSCTSVAAPHHAAPWPGTVGSGGVPSCVGVPRLGKRRSVTALSPPSLSNPFLLGSAHSSPAAPSSPPRRDARGTGHNPSTAPSLHALNTAGASPQPGAEGSRTSSHPEGWWKEPQGPDGFWAPWGTGAVGMNTGRPPSPSAQPSPAPGGAQSSRSGSPTRAEQR